MRQAPVTIQIAPHSSFRDPFLDGEGAAFARILAHTGILTQIQEQV